MCLHLFTLAAILLKELVLRPSTSDLASQPHMLITQHHGISHTAEGWLTAWWEKESILFAEREEVAKKVHGDEQTDQKFFIIFVSKNFVVSKGDSQNGGWANDLT